MISSPAWESFMLQKFRWIAVALVIAAPAWAQSNSGGGNGLQQCSGVADPASRLACYDMAQPPHGATAPGNTPPGPSRYPEFNSPRQSPAPPSDADAGGNSLRAAARGNLVAGVVSYSLSPSGRFTIVLDNGQVWRQVDSDDGVAQFRKQGRNIAAISKGFLWSYDLKLNAMSAVFKVTRLK